MNTDQRPPMGVPPHQQVVPPRPNIPPTANAPSSHPPAMNARPIPHHPAGAIPPRPAYGQPLRPMVQPVAPSGAVPLAPSQPGARPMDTIQQQPVPNNIATAPTNPQLLQRPPAATANNLVAPMQNMHIQQQQQQQQQPGVAPQQKHPHPRRVYPQMPGMPSSPQQAPMPQQQQQQQPMASPASTAASPQTRTATAGVGYTQGPYTHTGQQLPPELRPPQQPRPRIDPDQMPAPVQVREQDQLVFGDKFFGTIERDRVPLATTNYIGLDQGNCNPRFMRATVDKIPYSKDIADLSKLPLGLVVQPLAKQKKEEVSIQVVDHGQEGPVRCNRCRAYINPWCTFTQGGSRFICNICSHVNEVPSWYFANIDMSGRRVDADQKPELRYGSVEFAVPAEYNSTRSPTALNYIFALDVSAQAVQSGMVQACCDALEKTLFLNGTRRLPSGVKVGILTFDRTVHFYNLSSNLSQAQMLVVSDIDDMFIPLQHGFLVDPAESASVITDLLQSIPHMYKDNMRPESVFTSAVRGALTALNDTGGQVFVFQSCLPNHGADMLRPREDKSLYNTDKEKQLFNSQNDTYKSLGNTCVDKAVCVHTWLLSSQNVDVATLGVISTMTGGDVRYYPNFNSNESNTIAYQLDHDVHRETGFDGVVRIRCSDGLQVIDHYGNCRMSTYTDMDLAGIDEDKAFAAVLKHDSKLDFSRNVCFQCALLYTTKTGERRVRVHNLSLTATNQIADVFRTGDVDATISVMARKAIFDCKHKSRRDIHKKLTEDCVAILTAYRTNCAATTSAGQLILPEAFKLLPIYIHGSMRSQALRGVGLDVNSDVRVASMMLLNGLGVYELVSTLYPRMIPVSNMPEDCGVADLKGHVKLPPMIRTSYERLDSKGAYLLDTGSDLYFWLGNRVSSEFIQHAFGVSTLEELDVNMALLPFLDNPLSEKIHDIVRQLQSERSRYLQLRIVRQDKDPQEFVFSTWMVEDRNAEVQTYVDYMCVLHRKIQDEMKKNSNY